MSEKKQREQWKRSFLTIDIGPRDHNTVFYRKLLYFLQIPEKNPLRTAGGSSLITLGQVNKTTPI